MAQKKVHYNVKDHEIVIENQYLDEYVDKTNKVCNYRNIIVTTIRLDERTVTVRCFDDTDGSVLSEETRSFDHGHEKYDIESLLTMAIRDDD